MQFNNEAGVSISLTSSDGVLQSVDMDIDGILNVTDGTHVVVMEYGEPATIGDYTIFFETSTGEITFSNEDTATPLTATFHIVSITYNGVTYYAE